MTTGRPEPLDKFFPFSPFLLSVPPSPIPGLVLEARGTWLKGCNGEMTYSLPYFTLLPPILFPGCPKALNSTHTNPRLRLCFLGNLDEDSTSLKNQNTVKEGKLKRKVTIGQSSLFLEDLQISPVIGLQEPRSSEDFEQ